jgi:glutaredoxin
MIQVYQAEWCPHSASLRQRLTELGVDYVARQVAAYPEDRDELREATGCMTIPVVVLEDGTVLGGQTEEIIAGVEERLGAMRGEAWEEGHREQALAHA